MTGTHLEAVAEAIRAAHNEVVFGESDEEAWLRLAAAAVDALQLTEETRTRSTWNVLAQKFTYRRESRLVGPWVVQPERNQP